MGQTRDSAPTKTHNSLQRSYRSADVINWEEPFYTSCFLWINRPEMAGDEGEV